MKYGLKYCGLILAILALSILTITYVKVESNEIIVSSIIDEEALVESNDTVSVIVGFNEEIGNESVDLLREKGAYIKRILTEIKAISIRISPEALQELEENPEIKYIEENNKSLFVIAQTLPWGIDKIDAELVHPEYRGAGVIVSIPDTGIDKNHEDLLGRVIAEYDYVNDDWDAMDDYGHGTHCAGTVAANDNSLGVIGVAPEADLYALKMLDSTGSGYWDDAAASVIDSANWGANIISMSWGGSYDSPALKDAILYADSLGVLLIAAAGNDWGGPIIYPAKYPEVMAITATDQNDVIAYFSSIGPEAEAAAPGVDVLSTVPTGTCPLCDPSGYAYLQGTSMACPHVSGTAALIWSSDPGLSSDQVRDRITDYAVDRGDPGRDELYGFGRINAYASVYQIEPSVAKTALVLKDNTLFKGFMDGQNDADLNGNGVEDGIELWKNAITYMVGTPSTNDMNVFVRGSDDALWYQSYDGTAWSGWTCLGGIVRDDPDAASLNSETYIFVRGADDALWYRTIGTGWQSLGGIINISPGAASYDGKIYVFVRGSDDALWYKSYDGTSWSSWTSLGGILNSGPGATSCDGVLNVFVRGSDDALWYQSYDGTSWSGWTSLGGIVRDDPDAASLNSETNIFVRGADDALWYRTIGTGWQSLGGIINISPGAASYEGEINVFARGTDSALWYQSYDGTTWSGWACLGGILYSGPGAS